MNWLKKLFGKTTEPSNPQSTKIATVASPPTPPAVKPKNLQSTTSASPPPSPAPTASSSAPTAKHYEVYGLDLAPDVARKLSFEQACKQVAGLRVFSDGEDRLGAAKGNDYNVLLHFKKAGGLFEAEINPSTTSGFLGMGAPEPERVWSQLGYRLIEDLGEKATWSNGDAKIVAYGSRSGKLSEIHYVVPDKPAKAEAEATAWRELGFFGGGRGCVESARLVTGKCYANEDAVNSILRYTKEEWKGSLPQGFWLVKAEVDDTSADCRYCLGYDSQHETIWQTVAAAMEKAGRLPQCVSKPFRLAPNDLFMQTQIETIYIKGLLGHA